jgi:hypothetical protein
MKRALYLLGALVVSAGCLDGPALPGDPGDGGSGEGCVEADEPTLLVPGDIYSFGGTQRYLFFSDRLGTMSGRASKCNGQVTEIPVPPKAMAGVVIPGTELSVYEARQTPDGAEVYKRDLNSGEIDVLVRGQAAIGRMLLDRDSLYWTSYAWTDPPDRGQPRPTGEANCCGIVKFDLQDRTATLLVSANVANEWVLDRQSIYYAVQAASVKLYRVSAQGGDPVLLHEQPLRPYWLTADVEFLYWIDCAGDWAPTCDLVRQPKTGGAVEVLYTSDDIGTLALDDQHIYFEDGMHAKTVSIVRLPKAGGTPETLVENVVGAVYLEVDTTHIYWASKQGIMKVKK